jgi:hypothetical protein
LFAVTYQANPRKAAIATIPAMIVGRELGSMKILLLLPELGNPTSIVNSQVYPGGRLTASHNGKRVRRKGNQVPGDEESSRFKG